MAIQMRRGNQVDFNPANMLPGEWAISQDNEKVYMCFSAGRVMEIGSASALAPYIQDAEAWARGTKDGEPVTSEDAQYQNNSKYYSDRAEDLIDNFEEQFPTATTERPTGADYVTLTVTDVHGPTETRIYDGDVGPEGPEGPEGYSPEVSISTIAGGHRVTITDKDHPLGQNFDVLDGAGSGDMQASTYDSNSTVATAGGITSYVSSQIDQSYNASSTKAQSGVAVASAISGKANTNDLAQVATSGDFTDLQNRPETMVGATSSVAGTGGLVPTPSAGDEDKVLKGDGTWGEVSGGASTWSDLSGKPFNTLDSHTFNVQNNVLKLNNGTSGFADYYGLPKRIASFTMINSSGMGYSDSSLVDAKCLLASQNFYVLMTDEYNSTSGAYRGHHAYLIIRPHGNLTPKGIALAASSDSGVTVTYDSDGYVNIKASAATYYVDAQIYQFMYL